MTGKYIVFEGVVGCGKTTQSKLLVDYLKKKLDKEIIWTREPGGSEIAESIRKVVQGTDYSEKIEPICDAYLFAAARAQTRRSVVKPAKDRGAIVIGDRSECASYAFQGEGEGLGINKVIEINKLAIDNMIPDLVIYLEIDPVVGLKRTSNKSGDKFEKRDVEFFKKVQSGYEELSEHPLYKERWITIDGSGTKEEVHKRVKKAVTDFLQSHQR